MLRDWLLTPFVNPTMPQQVCYNSSHCVIGCPHHSSIPQRPNNLMLKRSVPSVIVRFILDGYTRHRMCAQWERHTSRTFHVCNGVKQGAVISPILFAIYYDELIAKLASSGYGCRISQHFIGALSYADDITLLSPSLKGLRYMLNICEEYGKEFHVTFNDKKTTGMVFGTSNVNCKAIQVNGNNVDWVSNAKHLGNVVDDKLSELKDINAKKGHFIASVNWFVGNFRGKVPIECYIRLFQSYCSTHYGSILWPLHGRGFNDFCATAVPIMAQFYGHYMVEVLTIFARLGT